MAKIEPKLEKHEFNKLINAWVEKKKINPSKMDRILSYKIYNQLFNANQRSPEDCTCLDKDVDYKVTKELERYLKLDPLPIESNVKIDFSSMGSNEVLSIFEEEEEIKTPPTKKAAVKSKKPTNGKESKVAE